MPAAEAAYEPLVLVDTSTLTEEQWLDYRRLGIGGSDAAAVLGISPFRTARDLYYDKLNIASVVDDDGNWVAMKMGHLLEDRVAEIFSRKTGVRPRMADGCRKRRERGLICREPALWRAQSSALHWSA